MKKTHMTDLDIQGTAECKKEALGSRERGRSSSLVSASLKSFEDLLKIDQQREKDGFPKKIKINRVLAGAGKIVVVPYVEEEKLIHGAFEPMSEIGGDGDIVGHGEGDVGDVIGEVPLYEGEGDDGSDGSGAGSGGSSDHGIETEAYEAGVELSRKFKLPNLKDKGKRIPTNEYIYDLTDRHRGSGQVLDKKPTLKRILLTNILLNRFDIDALDAKNIITCPRDKVFRVLSREKVWKSQAVAFFLRDYSGSMWGEPTKAIVTQHLMIYAWLLVQYEKLVIPRFIVHDHRAKEVSVEDYFRRSASGGTFIASGYEKINEIVEGESLARDYNIYVFQGTDGDDSDTGEEAIPELLKILGYANRMGVSVLQHPYYTKNKTPFETYIAEGDVLERKDVFRMHVMPSLGVTDEKNIEAIQALINQE